MGWKDIIVFSLIITGMVVFLYGAVQLGIYLYEHYPEPTKDVVVSLAGMGIMRLADLIDEKW